MERPRHHGGLDGEEVFRALTEAEPAICDATINKETGKSKKLRRAFVLERFEEALGRKKRVMPPTPKLLETTPSGLTEIGTQFAKKACHGTQWQFRL